MNYNLDAIYAALSQNGWDVEDQPTGEQIDTIITAYQAQQGNAQPKPERTQDEALVEAFHTVYDIKDSSADPEVRYSAFEAIRNLQDLARKLGKPLPERFDGQGRPKPERTWMFTISANFTAPTEDEAWADWMDWLSQPSLVEDGTQVTELQDQYDDGTPSVHLQGTEGQDRESYTDDQDRDYTVTDVPNSLDVEAWQEAVAQDGTRLGYADWRTSKMSAEDRAAWERDSYG